VQIRKVRDETQKQAIACSTFLEEQQRAALTSQQIENQIMREVSQTASRVELGVVETTTQPQETVQLLQDSVENL